MASIKWSALVSEVKGVLNGSVLSHSRLGQTIRNRSSRLGRPSSAWTSSRVALAYIASQWRTLSAAEQASWAAMCASYPYIDKFGNPQTPSGYQLFCTLNSNIKLVYGYIDTVPHIPTAESDVSPASFDTNAIGGLEINFTPTAVSASYILLYASAPLSAGVTVPPRYMRFLCKLPDDSASPFTITTDYLRIFPLLPSGSRVFLRAEQINFTNGQRYATCSGFVDIP